MAKQQAKANCYDCKWFIWPVNFDPVWLENCDGFEPKEVGTSANCC